MGSKTHYIICKKGPENCQKGAVHKLRNHFCGVSNCRLTIAQIRHIPTNLQTFVIRDSWIHSYVESDFRTNFETQMYLSSYVLFNFQCDIF